MARGGKKLSAEERALWSRIARSTNPLPGRMEALLSSSAGSALKQDRAETPAPQPSEPERLTRARREALAGAFKGDRSGSDQQAKRDSRAAPRRLNPIDKPVHRKLARGRLPLEGRLDLHGLDQGEAHGLLYDFLLRAHARGLRHVLVITGKGTSMGSEGALKRAVPQWLSKPEFAAIVSGHDWAARGHGGEGALYVRLKRKREPAP